MYNDAVFSLTQVSTHNNVNTRAKPSNQNWGQTVINLLKQAPLFNPSLMIISHLYLFLNKIIVVFI